MIAPAFAEASAGRPGGEGRCVAGRARAERGVSDRCKGAVGLGVRVV